MRLVGTATVAAVLTPRAGGRLHGDPQRQAAGHLLGRVVIVGADEVGAELAEVLREHSEYGLVPVGFVDIAQNGPPGTGHPTAHPGSTRPAACARPAPTTVGQPPGGSQPAPATVTVPDPEPTVTTTPPTTSPPTSFTGDDTPAGE